MKKTALEELREQKSLLKAEILEIEKNLPFNNVNNTLSYIGKGITKLINPEVDFQHPIKTDTKTNLVGLATDLSIKIVSSILVNKLIKSNLKSSSIKKRVIANVAVYALPYFLNKLVKIVDENKNKNKI